MSRFSQALLNKQRQDALRDRQVAEKISEIHGSPISQQTYNSWKKGRTPTDAYAQTLTTWLGVDMDELNAMLDESREASASAISIVALNQAPPYGKISDRKVGKYRFEPYNLGRKRVPEGRYTMAVDTKVMEPIFRVGTRIWVDPTVIVTQGHEVIVHSDGFGWIGVLERWDGTGVVITRPSGDSVTITKVEAIHVIILSSRVPA